MRKVGAFCILAALTAVTVSPQPAAAFGLRLGPFHIGVPIPWAHRHHHRLYMRASPSDVQREERPAAMGRGTTTALLYPTVALSTIFQNIFEPAATSPWPFGYPEIFSTAFARTSSEPDRRLCQPSDDGQAFVGRVSATLSPTADQMPLLQKLGGAMGAASGYLAKSCPSTMPEQPVARLKLMREQMQHLSMAVDMVRPPLQDFEHSLDDEQKARFAAMIEAQPATDQRGQGDIAQACASAPEAIDWSIDRIDRSVQPNATQREALDGMKQTFSQAAKDLQAHCPSTIPATALGRLEIIEARLDSSWRAILSIQVALANFETKLSEAQKTRFDRTSFAAR